MRRLDLLQACGNKVERLVPRGLLHAAALAATANQRVYEAIGMVDRLVDGRALWTEHPMIVWKVVAWLDADHLALGHLEVHGALHAAVAAVCRHVAIDLVGGLPGSWLGRIEIVLPLVVGLKQTLVNGHGALSALRQAACRAGVEARTCRHWRSQELVALPTKGGKVGLCTQDALALRTEVLPPDELYRILTRRLRLCP